MNVGDTQYKLNVVLYKTIYTNRYNYLCFT